ncbi:MAG TPA: hypothetical protein VFI11_07995 [Anaerolineales bacterium]|nr:hypothetical protein [Anaerolineales bacterium]
MKTWRWILFAAFAAAAIIVVGSSLLEAQGRLETPWLGSLSARLADRRWGPPGGYLFVEANPFVDSLAGLLSQYLVGVLILFTVPRHVRRLSEALKGGTRPLLRFLVTGILLAAALVALVLLTAFYVHLFPLPIVLVFTYLLAALGGVVAIEYEVGRDLLRRGGWPQASPLLALAVGCVLVFAATRIPYLGPYLLALAWMTGAGLVLATRLGSGGPWSLAALREDRQA